EGFDAVLDSALYHCLGEQQRDSYAAALHRVTAPGAALHLYCFTDAHEQGFQVPMTVSRENLREHLGTYWNVRSIEATEYATAITLELLDQVDQNQLAQAGFAVDRERVRTDDQGRILGGVWHLYAQRA